MSSIPEVSNDSCPSSAKKLNISQGAVELIETQEGVVSEIDSTLISNQKYTDQAKCSRCRDVGMEQLAMVTCVNMKCESFNIPACSSCYKLLHKSKAKCRARLANYCPLCNQKPNEYWCHDCTAAFCRRCFDSTHCGVKRVESHRHSNMRNSDISAQVKPMEQGKDQQIVTVEERPSEISTQEKPIEQGKDQQIVTRVNPDNQIKAPSTTLLILNEDQQEVGGKRKRNNNENVIVVDSESEENDQLKESKQRRPIISPSLTIVDSIATNLSDGYDPIHPQQLTPTILTTHQSTMNSQPRQLTRPSFIAHGENPLVEAMFTTLDQTVLAIAQVNQMIEVLHQRIVQASYHSVNIAHQLSQNLIQAQNKRKELVSTREKTVVSLIIHSVTAINQVKSLQHSLLGDIPQVQEACYRKCLQLSQQIGQSKENLTTLNDQMNAILETAAGTPPESFHRSVSSVNDAIKVNERAIQAWRQERVAELVRVVQYTRSVRELLKQAVQQRYLIQQRRNQTTPQQQQHRQLQQPRQQQQTQWIAQPLQLPEPTPFEYTNTSPMVSEVTQIYNQQIPSMQHPQYSRQQ